MKDLRVLVLLAPWLMAPQCGGPNHFQSEEGQWSFTDTGLSSGMREGLDEGESLLPDARICPGPVSWLAERDEELSGQEVFEQCVQQDVEGPASLGTVDDRDCVLMEGSGEVRWLLEPQDCALDFGDDPTPVSDQVVFSGADASLVTAHVLQWMEVHALEHQQIDPPGVFTEDDLLQPGETLVVLGGAPVRLFVQLWDPTHEQSVAWRPGEGELTVVEADGYYTEHFDLSDGIYPNGGWIGLELSAGRTAELGFEIRGQTFGGALIEAVPASRLASLEVVAVYDEPWTDLGGTVPTAARAIVRDDQGRQVLGVPATWSVSRGRLAVEPGGKAREDRYVGADYASVSDACTHLRWLEGRRSAVLRASYGDLNDDLKMEWEWPDDWVETLLGGDEEAIKESYASWEPDFYCIGQGCTGCSGSGTALSWAWALGALGFALTSRRAPSAPDAPSSSPHLHTPAVRSPDGEPSRDSRRPTPLPREDDPT